MTEALRRVLQRNMSAALRKLDFDEAERLLAQLREEDPLSVQTRGLELEYLVYRKQFEQAQRLAPQLIHLFPGSARIHYLAGRLAYAQRKYADAETHFRESDRLFPHWFTQLFLGKTLTQKGDFPEAERILSGLVDRHSAVRRDLSWLYERLGDHSRAVHELQQLLVAYPDDKFAQTQLRRLRAQGLEPSEIIEEVQALEQLGETIEDDLLPQYVDSLLRTGQGAEARTVVHSQVLQASRQIALKTAWICYRLQAFDIAYSLFTAVLPQQLKNFKMLSALEASARRCGRVEDLRALYGQHAPQEPTLFGRLRSLR